MAPVRLQRRTQRQVVGASRQSATNAGGVALPPHIGLVCGRALFRHWRIPIEHVANICEVHSIPAQVPPPPSRQRRPPGTPGGALRNCGKTPCTGDRRNLAPRPTQSHPAVIPSRAGQVRRQCSSETRMRFSWQASSPRRTPAHAKHWKDPMSRGSNRHCRYRRRHFADGLNSRVQRRLVRPLGFASFLTFDTPVLLSEQCASFPCLSLGVHSLTPTRSFASFCVISSSLRRRPHRPCQGAGERSHLHTMPCSVRPPFQPASVGVGRNEDTRPCTVEVSAAASGERPEQKSTQEPHAKRGLEAIPTGQHHGARPGQDPMRREPHSGPARPAGSRCRMRGVSSRMPSPR